MGLKNIFFSVSFYKEPLLYKGGNNNAGVSTKGWPK